MNQKKYQQEINDIKNRLTAYGKRDMNDVTLVNLFMDEKDQVPGFVNLIGDSANAAALLLNALYTLPDESQIFFLAMIIDEYKPLLEEMIKEYDKEEEAGN